jgi:hypothetical protein
MFPQFHDECPRRVASKRLSGFQVDGLSVGRQVQSFISWSHWGW